MKDSTVIYYHCQPVGHYPGTSAQSHGDPKKAGKVVRAASAIALAARQSQRTDLQAQAAVQRCDTESGRWGRRGYAHVDTRTKIPFEIPFRRRQCFMLLIL